MKNINGRETSVIMHISQYKEITTSSVADTGQRGDHSDQTPFIAPTTKTREEHGSDTATPVGVSTCDACRTLTRPQSTWLQWSQ